MNTHHSLYSILFSLSLSLSLSHQSILRLPSDHRKSLRRRGSDDDSLYCNSWRFSVETNDAGMWSTIPSRCAPFVRDYITGEQYTSDSSIVAANAAEFARTVGVSAYGRDAWVFDIDETLLSNLPYYEEHGFGSEGFEETSFDDWVDLAEAPALPASLVLYNELRQQNFTIFLLTGRSEYQRNATVTNLLRSGFRDWEKLILRGDADQGKPATVYKSEKRSEIVSAGYTIHGSSGDQWSDLAGFATATRSFKLPNPMLEAFEETSFDDWVDLAEAPALFASLALYNELRQLNFTFFLLTGRSEYQRNATVTNLSRSGFRDWEKLILRQNFKALSH